MPRFFVEPRIVHPPWGGTRLGAEFGKGEGNIGESWEAWPDGVVRGRGAPLSSCANLPILVKLLDTRALLSVQVHPNARQAAARAGANGGKAEAWVVLAAEPEAKIALGLSRPLTAAELRNRAIDGEIKHDLNWISPRAGDVIDVPPGTIHAIGPGLTLYEVQEPTDITWRLYDWGRGRELHLDHACAVATRAPRRRPFLARDVFSRRTPVGATPTILQRPAFNLRIVSAGSRWQGRNPAALTVVSGALTLLDAGELVPLALGQTVVLDRGDYSASGEGTALLAAAD